MTSYHGRQTDLGLFSRGIDDNGDNEFPRDPLPDNASCNRYCNLISVSIYNEVVEGAVTDSQGEANDWREAMSMVTAALNAA